MRTRKAFAVFTICALSALSVPDGLSPRPGRTQPINDQAGCSKLVTGTYLTTISSTSTGEFASRSVIILYASGIIRVNDSNQNGVPGVFRPFSESYGAWKCTGNREIIATTDNFSYPTAEDSTRRLAKSNYSLTFNQQTPTVQGTIKLHFLDLNANPQGSHGSDGGTFTFTGQRITAE